jgi:hypothetical protein
VQKFSGRVGTTELSGVPITVIDIAACSYLREEREKLKQKLITSDSFAKLIGHPASDAAVGNGNSVPSGLPPTNIPRSCLQAPLRFWRVRSPAEPRISFANSDATSTTITYFHVASHTMAMTFGISVTEGITMALHAALCDCQHLKK